MQELPVLSLGSLPSQGGISLSIDLVKLYNITLLYSRLSSLFPTKDLTLGTSQPKRQFTPNLALAGKRANLPCETKNNKCSFHRFIMCIQPEVKFRSSRRDGESKKPYDRPNNRGGRGGTRGRGAGKNAEMVQAKGIFSEGVTIETFAKNKSGMSDEKTNRNCFLFYFSLKTRTTSELVDLEAD